MNIMDDNTSPTKDLLSDIAESIDGHLKQGKDVNVFSMPARMPIVNNFVLLFYNSFLQTIDDYHLTLNDVRVLLKIIELMKFGNLVKLTWSDVAKQLNIPRNNIARHVKKLHDAKLLISDNGGNTYLNPQIIAKGKFLQKENERLIELLDMGADELSAIGIPPNILTPKLKLQQEIKRNEQLYLYKHKRNRED